MKDNELNKMIGFEMRSQRLLKRVSLRKLADEMGVGKSTIAYWETGVTTMTVDDIKAYCDALGVKWFEIIEKVAREYENS